MAKQLRLNELRRDRPTVYSLKDLTTARTGLMNCPRQQFLTGPRLAPNKNRHGPTRGLHGSINESPHCCATIDDIAEPQRLFARSCAQLLELFVWNSQHIGDELGRKRDVERYRR